MFYEFTLINAPRAGQVAFISANRTRMGAVNPSGRPVAFAAPKWIAASQLMTSALWIASTLLTTGNPSFAQSPVATDRAGNLMSEFSPPDDSEPLAEQFPLPTAIDSAAAIELPADFVATVFASEPEVRNPIDMAWDFQGRMWVAENYTYAQRTLQFRDDLRDRVVVFEDADQDGTPETRKVFLDNVSKLTSVEVGRGGVWLMCPPRLLFVPDANHDAVPDGPPQTILDGFTVAKQNYHNFANGLRFGPDGWLYGRCGGSCPGLVGKPGVPEEDRVALEGGVWRYSVDQARFEVLCHGTTNPWGHDFNDVGELFFINTVNGHLWHGIPGAHFKRPFTLDPNLDAYELIDQHADHYHFDTTGNWTDSRDGAANDFGGGHAHSGMMIYQGLAWPAKYRGALMTLNFHGRRANVERLVRRGTGYVGKHDRDFFVSSDIWFRGMEMSAGPDGNVYVLDWSDLGECHEHTGVHRNSGRIFKISYEGEGSRPFRPNPPNEELATLNSTSLAGYQNRMDPWYSHQARLRLVELARSKTNQAELDAAVEQLRLNARNPRGIPELCQILWTLHQIDSDFDPRAWSHHDSPVIRGWSIRLMTQSWPIDDCYGPNADGRAVWDAIRDQAKQWIQDLDSLNLNEDASLRLVVASTLQRLPPDLRATAAARLLMISGDRDAHDHNQGKLIWYGIMSRAAEHPEEMIRLIHLCQLPDLTAMIARSLGEQIQSRPALLESLFEPERHNPVAPSPMEDTNPVKADWDRDTDGDSNADCDRRSPREKTAQWDHAAQWYRDVLVGLQKGLIGVRRVQRPEAWTDFRARALAVDPTLESNCQPLETLFNDGLSIDELVRIAGNPSTDIQDRLSALVGLVEAWHAEGESPAMIQSIIKLARPLVGDARINLEAARALSTIGDPKVADLLIQRYPRFRAPLRPQVISILCGRTEFASILLDALEGERLAKDVLSASQVRDLLALDDPSLAKRVESVWGRVRATSQERLAEIERLTDHLQPAVIASADRSAGRVLYDRVCASCHMMFGSGEQVGPDLTGAQRTSLDYLLHNIVDPDAVVGADYRAKKILTEDGRLLVGLVTQRTRRTLTLSTATRTQTIPLDEIENEFDTDQSPMPSGLLSPMTDVEIENLIAYLMSPTQVPAQTR